MKVLALVLGALMILGVAGAAIAQSSQPAQNPSGSTSVDVKSSDSKAPSTSVDVKTENRTESAPARPGLDVNVNKKDETTVKSDRPDDGAALPRGAAGERTTIFGLSPTAAVIVAAALLVVVILAIVAMTRSGAETTYIDRDRRPPLA
jgi:Flp pilus assembly protein TadB